MYIISLFHQIRKIWHEKLPATKIAIQVLMEEGNVLIWFRRHWQCCKMCQIRWLRNGLSKLNSTFARMTFLVSNVHKAPVEIKPSNLSKSIKLNGKFIKIKSNSVNLNYFFHSFKYVTTYILIFLISHITHCKHSKHFKFPYKK